MQSRAVVQPYNTKVSNPNPMKSSAKFLKNSVKSIPAKLSKIITTEKTYMQLFISRSPSRNPMTSKIFFRQTTRSKPIPWRSSINRSRSRRVRRMPTQRFMKKKRAPTRKKQRRQTNWFILSSVSVFNLNELQRTLKGNPRDSLMCLHVSILMVSPNLLNTWNPPMMNLPLLSTNLLARFYVEWSSRTRATRRKLAAQYSISSRKSLGKKMPPR